MSTTQIYGVMKNGDVEYCSGAANSWMGGMHVWNTLSKKYDLRDSEYSMSFKHTWDNFNKSFYKKYEDIVLGSTFDKVIVLKENFQELIENFEKYHNKYPNCNLGVQAETLKAMLADDNVIGVAWCQTSVCDDLWDFEYDEETDEVIPYNIFKGDQHWNLFEELVGGK